MGRWIHTLPLRVRSLFRRSRVEQELDEELRFHLDHLIEERIARGVPAEEARYAALREMAGIDQQKERCRDARRLGSVEDLAQDVRYAARTMRRNPGFTSVVVLSLALGIGANTAIFGAIDALMLRLLPVKDPRQLVMLTWSSDENPQALADTIEGRQGLVFPYAAYEQLRDENGVFANTFAFSGNRGSVNVGLRNGADRAAIQGVSGTYFDALGVAAAHGRTIQPADDRDSADPVLVVSYRFFLRALSGDPAIVGQAIVINGSPVTVAGVAPAEFAGLEPGAEPTDLWMPLTAYAQQQVRLGYATNDVPWTKDPRTWWVQIAARMRSTVAADEARTRAGLLFDRYVASAAGTPQAPSRTPRLGIAPMGQGLDNGRRQFSLPLAILMGMVSLVLLIACANVAGLLLARATAREHEIAIRLSLGAGRGRLIRQFLTESVTLGLLGGAAGLVVASWVNGALVALLSTGVAPVSIALRIDGRVLAFTAVVSLLTGIVFGLAPALRATRANVAAVQRLTSRKLLVAGQVAACLLLLVSAGLLIRTFRHLERVDLGFDREQIVLFTIRPGLNGYKGARLVAYYEELQRRIAALPQVRSVTFSRRSPIGGGTSSGPASIRGISAPGARPNLRRHEVAPRYFETLDIPILRGRSIGVEDVRSAKHVAVVSQALVTRHFGGADPIGHVLDFGSVAKPNAFEIVGVARDTKYAQLRDEIEPLVYLPYQQYLAITNTAVYEVRTDGEGEAAMAAIAQEARAIDPNVPVVDMKPMDEAVARLLVLERTLAAITTWFGVLALALAAVGLYGTMAYSVARRTREIGVRMALGADWGGIVRMVLRETAAIVLAGTLVGLALALAVTPVLGSQLFGLTSHDPATFGLAVALVVLVTLIAGAVPARRAARIDPMVALRCE